MMNRILYSLVCCWLLVLLAGCPSDDDVDDDATSDDDSAAGDDDDSTPLEVDCEAIWQASGTGFYEANPTYDDAQDDTDEWTFSAPADEGMDGDLIEDAVAEIENRPIFWSFLVLRHGAIVSEHYFNGAEALHSNNVHSASKSVLGAVTGIAIEQGYLSGLAQPISGLLPEHFATIDDPAKESNTVGQLLTMSSGFAWVEDSTEYQIEDEPDWVQAILDLPLAATPGDAFNYSTGNTHLLSAVLTEATGRSTCQYAHEVLLGPLGITAEHWGRDPQAYFSGGCNVYLTPRELARFGQVILDGGMWAGEPLVPALWVDESIAAQMDAVEGYSYGYLYWLTRIAGHDVAIAWGYGGQLVYVIPSLEMVVVFTTNTRDYYPDYDGYGILEQYLIPAAGG